MDETGMSEADKREFVEDVLLTWGEEAAYFHFATKGAHRGSPVADDATAAPFRELTGDAAHGTGGGGDEHLVASFHVDEIQPDPRRESGRAEDAEDRRAARDEGLRSALPCSR